MSNIERRQAPTVVGVNGGGLTRRTSRSLTDVAERTLLRTAEVQAEGYVQGAKLSEINHLARSAMVDHALLSKTRETLAAGDPLLADELRFFSDMARLGSGEIIADTISHYTRG